MQWLRDYSQKYGFKIWAYCLMKNHVHFIGVPMSDHSLAHTFNTLHMRYAQYFNQKNKVSGHLWQGRFYSCILDEKHLYAAVRYVENNPIRARITDKPQEYKWASARGHIYKEIDPVLANDCHLTLNITDWLSYLMEEDEEIIMNSIRQNTRTGRPCGNESFIKKIEEITGRRLTPSPRGRPRKRT